MIAPVIVLFIFVSILFLVEREYQRPNVILIAFIFLSMLLIITFRSTDMPDAGGYIRDFKGTSVSSTFEPGYRLLRDFARLLGREHTALYFVLGVVALFIKFKAILRLSPFFWGSILVYISNYFMLHDMIQIRAGVASGLFIWAIKYIADRNLKYFLLVTLLAVCMHYSTLVLLPLWFVPRIRIQRNIWIFVVPVCYVLALAHFTIGHTASLIPIGFVQKLWSLYQMAMKNGANADINIFNLVTLAKIVILTFLIYYSPKIESYYPNFNTWLMIYTGGFAAFVLCSDIPVIAFRISELLQTVEIIVIPLIAFTFRYRILTKTIIVTCSYLLLIISIYYDKLLL